MKSFFSYLFFLFVSVGMLKSQVSIVNTDTRTFTASPTSFTYTLPGGAGSQRALLFLVSGEYNNTTNSITGATYGGVSMTSITSISIDGAGKRNFITAFRLNEAQLSTVGSNSAVISTSGAYIGNPLESFTVAIFYLANVNQTTPIEDARTNSNGNANTIATANINAETNDLIFFTTNSSGSASTWVPAGTFTERLDVQAGNHSYQVATQLRPNNGVSSPSSTNNSINRLAILAFEVNVGSAPLPITLLNFNAYPYEDLVMLEWESASEKNNAYYTIEHSEDAINWKVLSNIEGAGTKLTNSKYNCVDESPLAGLNYYRLKQVDYDGLYEYFNTVVVNRTKNSQFLVYPNPFKNKLNVEADDLISWELFTQAGQLIMKSEGKEISQILNTENLVNGFYVLKMNSKSGIKYLKLVKE